MLTLKTVVTRETKARFRNIAKTRGLSESELLRSLILAVTDEDHGSDQFIQPDAERVDITRMTVRMPRFLMEAACARAKSKGMAPSRWVTAMVQSNLTNLPVMTDVELAVLKTSSRELAAIGRNLNRIAHTLNQAFHETEQVRLEKLAQLSQAIMENRAAIRALVRTSQNAWDACDGTNLSVCCLCGHGSRGGDRIGTQGGIESEIGGIEYVNRGG